MTEQTTGPSFELEKIYLKDVSFESPASPAVFTRQDYKPEIHIDLNVEHRIMDRNSGYFEVVLNLEVRAAMADSTAFLVTVQQAGIFRLRGFSDEQMPIMVEVACPNSLLPFAREAVADLVTRGGFPQLLIQPVNFEALLKEKIRKAQEQKQAGSGSPDESPSEPAAAAAEPSEAATGADAENRASN